MTNYGYEVWLDARRFFLIGDDPGVSFSSALYREAGVQTVVLTNIGSAVHNVARRISEVLS